MWNKKQSENESLAKLSLGLTSKKGKVFCIPAMKVLALDH
jgi:hypothetical protein